MQDRSTALVRLQLDRHGLAHQRFRASVPRATDLNDSDVATLTHLCLTSASTPSQLAARMELTSGGTSALIGRLVRRGYLSASASPSDGRSRVLALTPHATTELAQHSTQLVAALDQVLDDLSAEQAAWVGSLAREIVSAVATAADAIDRQTSSRSTPDLLGQGPGLWG